MIEGKFEYAIGAKPVGFSHDFGLVIQALHNAARDQLLSPEVVEDELAVLTQRACDLLHRLDAGPHGLAAPLVEELARPGGRVGIPELLDGLLEKAGADVLHVVADRKSVV